MFVETCDAGVLGNRRWRCMPSGYVKRGHKKCRMAASPVSGTGKNESTGRPDKRSAIRLGNT
ncbi:hypothetical protein KCP71_15305 [Salmonella enterica subsp. enterica]|nr:hypothetical protein KCP71_15305 [Salmonella enterica subsp. enterica]